jgi:hypothetical protein
MVWQISNWVTIAFIVGILMLGIRMAAGPRRQGRPPTHRGGILLISSALAGLALRLPRTLGWPQSVRIALAIPAVLVLLIGFFMIPGVKRPRRNGRWKG